MLPATRSLIKQIAERHGVEPDEITSASTLRHLYPARIEIARALAERGYGPSRIARIMNRDRHAVYYWLNKLQRKPRWGKCC